VATDQHSRLEEKLLEKSAIALSHPTHDFRKHYGGEKAADQNQPAED
jgi:hypothetical protein